MDDSRAIPIGHPSAGGGTGDGHVAADADKNTRLQACGDAGCGPIGSQGFGGRTQVETHTARDPHGATARVELHVLIPGHTPQGPGRGRRTGSDLVQVGVVTERLHGVADSGIDSTTRPLGRLASDRECGEQQLTHDHGPARLSVHRLQLRVVPEPAAGKVESGELGREQTLGGAAVGGLLDDDGGGGSDGPERTGDQAGLDPVGAVPHDEVPPDVTVADEELAVGAEEEEEVDVVDVVDVPLFPVAPLEPPDELLPLDAEVEVEAEVEPDVDVFFSTPAPGRS